MATWKTWLEGMMTFGHHFPEFGLDHRLGYEGFDDV